MPKRKPNEEWCRGTWVLDQLESLTDWENAKPRGIDQAMAMPTVNGVSIRCKWSILEPAPGVYDFTIFDTVRAAYPNRRMSVRFMAGRHTPTFHKGHTVTHNGYTYPKPWNPDKSGGNPVFVAGWANMVNAITQWSAANRVRLVHLSQYGWDWAELFNGVELKNAWRADFGSTEPVGVGSQYNAAVTTAHKELIDRCAPMIPPNTVFELPASGYSSQEISPTVFAYARTKFAAHQLGVQSNCWGGPYRCGRALGVDPYLLFGYQAYAVAGPSNQTSPNRNLLTWSQAYTGAPDWAGEPPDLETYNVTKYQATYTEVYRETFADTTDRSDLAAVLDRFTYPVVTKP